MDLLQSLWQGRAHLLSRCQAGAASHAAAAYRECLTYILLHLTEFQPQEGEDLLTLVLREGFDELALRDWTDPTKVRWFVCKVKRAL